MIHGTQRGLIRIFTVTILATSFAVMASVALYDHLSLEAAMRRHLLHEIQSELVPYYGRNDLTSLEALSESDYFQILNRNGEVVISTVNAQGFDLLVDKALITAAFSGEIRMGSANVSGEQFLVAYFPLDDYFVGRAATAQTALQRQRQGTLWLAVFGMPILAVLSFLVSRYLVLRAMRPVAELFTFHTTFASNVSHELRTPLTSLRGNLEVALRQDQTAEEYRAVLTVGLREAERLVGTLDDLSLLATSQSRGVALSRSNTDLRSVLEEVLAAERSALDDGQLSIHLAAPEPVPCWCDSALLRHALRNLVLNAVRYTPPGETITVQTRLEQGHATVILANPCDPPRKPVAALLEPFQRGDNRAYRLPHGRGLGLYLAHYIARAHGGGLTVSLEQPGNRFVVELTVPTGG